MSGLAENIILNGEEIDRRVSDYIASSDVREINSPMRLPFLFHVDKLVASLGCLRDGLHNFYAIQYFACKP